MLVRSIANTGDKLPSRYLDSSGETTKSVYYVTVDKVYRVFAMALWNSNLKLLLLDDTNLPSWYPVHLFSVTDPTVPADWLCAVNMRNEGGMQAIWGYERIVSDDAHNDALMERERDALQVFQLETQRRLRDSA